MSIGTTAARVVAQKRACIAPSPADERSAIEVAIYGNTIASSRCSINRPGSRACRLRLS